MDTQYGYRWLLVGRVALVMVRPTQGPASAKQCRHHILTLIVMGGWGGGRGDRVTQNLVKSARVRTKITLF